MTKTTLASMIILTALSLQQSAAAATIATHPTGTPATEAREGDLAAFELPAPTSAAVPVNMHPYHGGPKVND